ncbi:hypothetical protein Pint_12361 [Pistacia integerrima]|uniref:Uncharacterized protein n=1 Tax=Pistacia integerrima TaxID=434235 RepID=A0ACC0Y6L4_9ROSI|nr:hypothetical protein Pint_12361 [Pistacia integerrima]
MNRRLNLNIPQNNTFLLPRDVLAAADHLIGLKFGMGTLDDMNHLKNKRIRSVADLLQDQFGLALVRLENGVRGTICGAIRHKLMPTPQNLVTSTPLTTTYDSFFGLHPLSQVLDRTNPLTQIVHGRKSSYLGPGGLTGRTASFRIRDIHPSHYGRICPIDTSEGINVGLIGSLAIHARIGYWGSLESPFYEIFEKSKKVRMLYLSPSKDEYYMVAAGNSLALNQGIPEEQVVPTRYRQEFLTIAWEQVHLRIPLSRSEKCIVGTGLERQAALDSGVPAIAQHEGKIIYTDIDKIVLSGNGDTLSGRGRVIDVRWIQKKGGSSSNPERIRVYISQKREIKVGDKVAGRHGNKGIISKILPRQDMPYLQDGGPVDMVFNPLGVPSRMNVGQIFECSLGLAGGLLNRHYRIAPFDERYEQEASRKLVFSELYEASKQTANPWVFEPEYPGKSRIFDGRTGDPFEQPVIIGKPYILKLIHQVDDKIHGRSSGHYALVTQQPLRGRSKQGGQRVGEMEIRNMKLSSQSIELGCPESDMSLGKSNMKLRMMGFDTFRNREISTGAVAIREQLADLDLRMILDYSLVEWKELGEEGPTEPEWMVLCLLPVLPPELRPIIQIDGGKLMSSDINELYRRVIYRNNTLTDLLTTSRSTPGELVMCQEKLVQEAVDTLLDNGIRGQPTRDGHNKVYKSFSDVIEGKEGRFRETLLGKRVDYSGRSVIVVGPSLSLHRCGLPREIAIELFQTFVICGLIRQHLASNIGVAKSKIREKGPIVWEILQEVMQGHPVLLNRAPTLHRLGIQAFQPILVEGRAICLHPLVCKGFNADFDGDQMAVHVPLSLEAQAEARLLMFSHMNLLSPAIGDPISVPTQDMLIGLYVLTNGNRRGICANRSRKGSFPIIDSNPLSNPTQRNMEVLMAERASLVFHNKMIDGTAIKRLISRLIDHFGMAYTSHILDQVKTLGFQQATATSISLGIDDLLTIPSKGWLVQDAEQQSLILEKHHHYGNVHAVEKLRQSIEIWYATSEYLRQEMNPNFRMTDPFNPVHIMSFSGARGNASQVHQLVGMRGLMSDPQGQMIDLPIQSNLREGLSLTEYIISCYGARKGVVDTAVRTSDAGYLTRRLVEVVQHIVVRRTDCGTLRGISVSPQKMSERVFSQILIGRVLADDIYMGLRCIAIRNQDIGIGLINRFITFRTQAISIRTPFTCRSTSWICRLCYGRSPTHGDLVELGEAVGIISGQSIGEPGTQLTLRTFHTGGVFTGGTAEHVRAPSNGKIKFNEDLVHPTRTRHGHPAFLCSIDLYVIIESEDIMHNVTIPPKSFLLVQNDQYVESEQVIAEIRAGTYTLNFKEKEVHADPV